MCGRYAMGAAHLAFLNDLQGQYGRLFPNRRRRNDDDESQDSGASGSGPMRLRGGGPEWDVACECGVKWERERDFWPRYVGREIKKRRGELTPAATTLRRGSARP